MSVTGDEHLHTAAREFIRSANDGRVTGKERNHNVRNGPDPAVVAALSAKSITRRPTMRRDTRSQRSPPAGD
jgi:hypothetical protein